MPTTRTATITLYEAYKTNMGFLIPNIVCGNHARHAVTFTSLDDLMAQGEKLAQDAKVQSGHGYWVSYNLPRGERKPRGFDITVREHLVGLTPEPERV